MGGKKKMSGIQSKDRYDYEIVTIGEKTYFRVFAQRHHKETFALCAKLENAVKIIALMESSSASITELRELRDKFNRLENLVDDEASVLFGGNSEYDGKGKNLEGKIRSFIEEVRIVANGLDDLRVDVVRLEKDVDETLRTLIGEGESFSEDMSLADKVTLLIEKAEEVVDNKAELASEVQHALG